MEFRKQIEIPPSGFYIDHRTNLFLTGSCFIDNIGKLLLNNKFKTTLNPFGTIYNPSSIAQSIDILLDEIEFTESDFFYDNGLYHSFYFHSSFSDSDLSRFLNKVNSARKDASLQLKNANLVIFTFGTSFVYRFIETNTIVANCHKIPANKFHRYRLSVDEIVKDWLALIAKFRIFNASAKIVFTVSPIRHWKDGANGNQLSKATLLLAIDEIIRQTRSVSYFPSYEILIDELRDYRFYADDMMHPSAMAIDYIWQKFSETFFDDSTKQTLKKWTNLTRSINHRPFNPNTEEYKSFLRQTLLKLQDFQNKYPYFECDGEIKFIESKLLSSNFFQ